VAHVGLERSKVPTRPLVRVLEISGTLSYGIYAWHGYLMKYVPWTSDKLVVLLVLSILLAWTSYWLVEVPALTLRRKPRQYLLHANV
jgi:peptidoglycan/LPS O-acetylase OafA/YrhL